MTDMDELNDFLDVLPQSLKNESALFIHAKTYKKIWFLQNQTLSFLAFICPLLKPLLCQGGEYVYQEGDEILSIYFLNDGVAGSVLPRHRNVKFIDYPAGSHFGVMDIVSSCFKLDIELDNWIWNHEKLKREFTVMCQEVSEILTLSIRDLYELREDFE